MKPSDAIAFAEALRLAETMDFREVRAREVLSVLGSHPMAARLRSALAKPSNRLEYDAMILNAATKFYVVEYLGKARYERFERSTLRAARRLRQAMKERGPDVRVMIYASAMIGGREVTTHVE